MNFTPWPLLLLLLLEVLPAVLLLLLVAVEASPLALAAAAAAVSLAAACMRSWRESFQPSFPLFFCCNAELLLLLLTDPHCDTKPTSSSIASTIMYDEWRMLRTPPLLLVGLVGRDPGSSYLLLLLPLPVMLQVVMCRCGVLLLAGAAALPCTTAPSSCCGC